MKRRSEVATRVVESDESGVPWLSMVGRPGLPPTIAEHGGGPNIMRRPFGPIEVLE